MDLNESKLELNKKVGPLETKTHGIPNTIHPKMGILTKVIYLMGFNLRGIEELTLPEMRQVCDTAQISKETAVGTAMIYLRNNR